MYHDRQTTKTAQIFGAELGLHRRGDLGSGDRCLRQKVWLEPGKDIAKEEKMNLRKLIGAVLAGAVLLGCGNPVATPTEEPRDTSVSPAPVIGVPGTAPKTVSDTTLGSGTVTVITQYFPYYPLRSTLDTIICSCIYKNDTLWTAAGHIGKCPPILRRK